MRQSPSTAPARPLFAMALRLASMAVLAVMFSGVKLAEERGVGVVECLFWRQAMGLPVVAAWLAATGRLREIGTQRPAAHAVRMTIGLSAMALNFTAVTLLPLAEATTIGFAVPLFATVFAALLLGEATGRWRWGAVATGFVGVLIVLQPGGAHIGGLGAAVALAGALATALVTIQIRYLGRTEATGAIVFWFSLSSLVPLGILMLFVGKPHDATGWLLILMLSGAGAVAQILLTAALRFGAVAAVLTMDYSALIWSLLAGWLIFGQLPAATTWIGAPLIVAAGLVIAWREHRLRRTAAVLTPD